MYRWIFCLLSPLVLVYVLTEHPQLSEPTFYGFTSAEVSLLHGVLWSFTAIMSLLFTRSRAVMVGLLTLVFSLGLPLLGQADFEATWSSLAYLAAGLCLLAAPEKGVFRFTSLIWLGLAALLGFGLFTLGEMYAGGGVQYIMTACVLVWGGVTLSLRAKVAGGAPESLMVATLLTAGFAGWTWGQDGFSATGFQVVCLGASLFSLASVVEHSFRLAYIDELTEIPGRRALVETMQDYDNVFTLAMLDVDHFKKFNDTHGHEVGDHVLRMVAARLSTVRAGGTAYRYGGEEFTVVFPGKTGAEVTEELERLRSLVETSPMILRGDDRPAKKPKTTRKSSKKKPSVSVTISIGAATRNRDEEWERVMKRADQALYKAKEEGRNRVCQAS